MGSFWAHPVPLWGTSGVISSRFGHLGHTPDPLELPSTKKHVFEIILELQLEPQGITLGALLRWKELPGLTLNLGLFFHRFVARFWDARP